MEYRAAPSVGHHWRLIFCGKLRFWSEFFAKFNFFLNIAATRRTIFLKWNCNRHHQWLSGRVAQRPSGCRLCVAGSDPTSILCLELIQTTAPHSLGFSKLLACPLAKAFFIISIWKIPSRGRNSNSVARSLRKLSSPLPPIVFPKAP